MRGYGETLVEYITGVDHLTVCTSHEKWKKNSYKNGQLNIQMK